MHAANKEKRALWAKHIQEWQASNKSGAQWCREHHLPYKTFLYWTHRLKESDTLLPAFVEINDTSHIGITLEYNGITIRLEQGFCQATFSQLINLLKQC